VERPVGDHLGTTRPARRRTIRTSAPRPHGACTQLTCREAYSHVLGVKCAPRPMSMTSIVRVHGDEQDVLLGEELHHGRPLHPSLHQRLRTTGSILGPGPEDEARWWTSTRHCEAWATATDLMTGRVVTPMTAPPTATSSTGRP
jgi:hypothetical protein